MNPQNRNLGIRLDAPLSARLEHFEQSTGVGAATLGRNALIAALDYFDQHGSISFPLRLIEASAVKHNIVPMPAHSSEKMVADSPSNEPIEGDGLTTFKAVVKRAKRAAKEG